MKLVKQISFYTTFTKANQTTAIQTTHKMQAVQHYTFIKPLQSLLLYFCCITYPDPQLVIAHRPQLFTKQICNLKHYKQRERERHQYHCKQMTDLDGARDGDRVEALSLGRSLDTAQAAIWIFQELEICGLFFLMKKWILLI